MPLDAKSDLNGKDSSGDTVKEKMLWVCDGCFKYLSTLAGYTSHTASPGHVIVNSCDNVGYSSAFPHDDRPPVR